MSASVNVLEWRSATRLVVDGTEFALAPTDIRSAREATDAGALLLRKGRWMVERYAALRSEIEPANVVELGIYEGGSAALLALLFRPRRLVAIDLRADRAEALDGFIEAHGLAGVIHPHYGVDQADRERVEALVADEFAGEPLDLVIDDASHQLVETTASFNVLFPRLRPGGLFVIEDWSWQHYLDEAVEERLRTDPEAREALARRLEAHPDGGRPDLLSRLVLELVLTAAYARDVVAEIVSLRDGWVVIRRGDAPLDRATFDISGCYGSLGRKLLA